jgi:hypothetical protein
MSLFQCDLYDRNRNWLAPVGSFVAVEGTARFDAISEFELTVKATHKRLGLMLTPGTRMKLRMRGETLIEGPIRTHGGAGPGTSTEFVFGVEDNFRILKNYLVYQVPGGTMAEQAAAYNWTETGNIEKVFKDMVALNIGDRSPEPIIIATNQNRGGTVTTSARMATVFNEMFPLLEEKGLGATVTATPAGLIVDVFVPGVYGTKLTEQSRIVRKWKYGLQAPDVTAVVVGGQGEGTARTFIEKTDSARELLWGDRIEVFRDARDASLLATYNDRADETLFDGGGTVGIKVTLAETSGFKIGGPTGLKVGQQVTASVANGMVEVTDILREFDFSWNAEDGLSVEAQIGQSVAPTAQISRAMGKLSDSLSKMKASQ